MALARPALRTRPVAGEAQTPPGGRTVWPLILFLLALVSYATGLARPSAWQDEAATRFFVARPVAEMWELTGTVDLVHRLYYLLGHAVWLAAGSPESSTAVYGLLRSVSAVAMAATAALTVVVGRRLVSTSVGVVAGVLVAASPMATRFGQEARSPAVTALAVVAAVAVLVVLTVPPQPGDTEGTAPARVLSGARAAAGWVAYALLIVVAGLLNLVSVLAVMPLALLVVLYGSRGHWWRFVASTVCAVALLSPFAWLTSRQSVQIDWLGAPGLYELAEYPRWAWGRPGVVVVAGTVLAGLLVRGRSRGGRASAAQTRVERWRPLVFAVVWGCVTPLFLWAVSQLEPLYTSRYVLFALAGLALTVAIASAPFPRTARLAVVAALVVAGVPAQLDARSSIGHNGEDLRGVATKLDRTAQPGDSFVFDREGHRVALTAYPEAFTGLVDVVGDPTAPLDSEPSAAYTVPALRDVGETVRRIRSQDRVWLITGSDAFTAGAPQAATGARDVLARSFVPGPPIVGRDHTLVLYRRR